ncbi:MAG: hypothetical protein M1816_003109 [Peltula sp. TS41687]|nr:MAG: hypothetical protein M1816_003109 [Peltula sp. TS41687]
MLKHIWFDIYSSNHYGAAHRALHPNGPTRPNHEGRPNQQSNRPLRYNGAPSSPSPFRYNPAIPPASRYNGYQNGYAPQYPPPNLSYGPSYQNYNYSSRPLIPNLNHSTGNVSRPWQNPYQPTRPYNMNPIPSNAPPIEAKSRRPLQITSSDARNTTNEGPNRPWQNRFSRLARPYNPTNNATAQPASTYHGEATTEELSTDGLERYDEHYDDHQSYEQYEQQYYWTMNETGDPSTENAPNVRRPTKTRTRRNEDTNAFFSSPKPSTECRNCKESFELKNRLHQHLRNSCNSRRVYSSANSSSNNATKGSIDRPATVRSTTSPPLPGLPTGLQGVNGSKSTLVRSANDLRASSPLSTLWELPLR